MNHKGPEVVVEESVESGLGDDFVKRIVFVTVLFAKKSSFTQISVVFVGRSAMKRLQQRYSRIHRDHVANVLAFTLSDTPRIGDIIICVPQAKQEARRYGHTPKAHIAFLIIHGVLHVLGFSHEKNVKERKKMEALEDTILHSLPQN